MSKSITKQWFRAFTLMALMLTTTLFANAAQHIYLRGDYADDSPGWSSNNFELSRLDDARFYIDFTVSSGFEFKLYYVYLEDEEGVWIGSTNAGYDNVAFNFPFTFTGVKPGEGDNMVIGTTGAYRFIYNAENFELEITKIPCPVEVATDLVGGTVTVDKTEAVAGETVTITVTPDYGYAATSSDVDVELTANPGNAHAPKRAPQVGDTFHPEGDAQATHDAPATYTFTMPEYPYGVYISTNFQELERYRISNQVEDSQFANHCTLTTDQPDNNAVPAGTVVTVTAAVTPAEDLFCDKFFVVNTGTLEYIDFTDNGDGSYTFVMPDNHVLIDANIGAYLHGVTFDENNHWATYYGAYDLEVPQGVMAYMVTGVENDEVIVEESNFIPMNTGALLYAEHLEAPMFNITTGYIGEIDTEATSLLQGSVEAQEISSGYVLLNDTFIRSQAGTLPAHRCYLPASAVPAGAPRVLKISRPDEGGVITGVDKINATDVVSVKYVSLTGVVSDQPFNGVNIVVETLTDGTTRTAKVVK